MPPNIEKWKHIGDWKDGQLVCRPDCPSEAHKKNPNAQALGKLGGQSTSEAKIKASRENLKKALEAKKLSTQPTNSKDLSE